MISLQKLELCEFQKHKHLVIDFCDGVNILHGSSDSGKSCIRRAIDFLCDFNVCDGVRKTGSKVTEVKGWFSNGVVLTRVRSQSINRYILEKDGEEKVFDSIGKSAPEEIINALGIQPLEVDGKKLYLNTAPQIGLPFLFDLSPSERAKLFNKLTGNDVLDSLNGQFNKDILRIKRELKEETKRFEKREIQLKSCKKEYEKAEIKHSKIKKQLSHIKELHEKYSKLLEIKELQEKLIASKNEANDRLKRFNFPQVEQLQQLKEKITKYDTLNTAKNALERVKTGLDRVSGQLKDYRVSAVDFDGLKGKIQRFDTLKSIQEQLDNKQKMCYTIEKNIKINDKELENFEKKRQTLISELNIKCPKCKEDISEFCIKEIHL